MAKKSIAQFEKKTLSTLKELEKNELLDELQSARKEFYVLSMKKELGELKQTHILRSMRKYIAQVSTFLASAL